MNKQLMRKQKVFKKRHKTEK